MSQANRRSVLGGLAASMAPSLGVPATSASTLAVRALAANPIASRFQLLTTKLDADRTAPVISNDGARRFSDLRGKVRLVSLWAEWCAPCLFELPDLAALNARFNGQGFEIIAVLTGSAMRLNWSQAHGLLRSRGADLPLWVEPLGGDTWFNNLATSAEGPSLPCNLIIDRRGTIRARSFGAFPAAPLALDSKEGRLTQEGKAKLLSVRSRSIWSTPAANDFVRGLLADALRWRTTSA